MMSWEIEVKLCGKYCCWICDFIFLKFNFFKLQLCVSGLLDYDKYKLVIYCEEECVVVEVVLLKEFIVYQMYNVLIFYSYWVYLLCICYVDSKGEFLIVCCYVFILESIK